MNVIRLNCFKRDYQKLPLSIQRKVDEQLRILVENPGYPSLRVKKIDGHPNCWEARISQEYRLTFTWVKNTLILRRVGTHDVLKKP